MDKNKIVRKDLIEAWERYVSKTNTCDDLALVLDSIMNDNHIQEFNEVFDNVVWNKAMNELPPTPEEREVYRKEFEQFFAEYLRKKQMQDRQLFSRINTGNRFRKIWVAAAAVLLLGLLIPSAYHFLKPTTEQPPLQYVETVTQRGEIRTILLPDRTQVTLNAGSRIIYPIRFSGDERKVELYGEALFDVTSDPERPFMVKTEIMNIRVVGTVFNVKSYSDDLSSSVSVASGKVEVGLADSKVLLEPNQQIKMEKSTGYFEKTTFDSGKYLSWTDGQLYFDRTPIREVINILNRHYPQVEIVLSEGEYADLITGQHKSVYPVEDILRTIIYSTGLKCKKAGNRYTLYN